MKRTFCMILAVGVLVGSGLTIGCQPAPEVKPAAPAAAIPENDSPPTAVPPEDLKALVDGNNAFAVDLYKKLAEHESGNIFFSPYSISAALAMTYGGARGETAAQMAKVLSIDKLGDRAHPAHAELARKLKSTGQAKPEFHVANALWGQRGFPFQPDFLSQTKRHYGGGFRELDFRDDTEGSRRTINKWVGDQTREKIPELLLPGSVNRDTRLVLTNAIYFKGGWTTPFQTGATQELPFHLAAGKKIPVSTMSRETTDAAYEGDGFKLAILPYYGGTISMIVLVPNEVDGLEKLEKKFTAASLRTWISKCETLEVNLLLPKLKLKERYGLTRDLGALGMREPFTGKADFRGIAEELYISDVVHEAIVEVDEEGTVAAAATAVEVSVESSFTPHPRSITVRADRPFLFLLYDQATHCILFLGRVANPVAAEK